MRLFCTTAFLALGIVVACRNATEPQPVRISGLYSLEDVNGVPLPATISAGAGDTTYIVSSILSLDSDGAAVTTNTLRHIYLQYPPEETTYVLQQAYRLTGDSIEIGAFEPCPGPVECVGNIHGTFDTSDVTVAEFYNPYPTNPIRYHYRLSHL